MRREILFRGKTKDGEWVFGHYLTEVGRGIDGCKDDTIHFIKDKFGTQIVDSETIGQFTGLTDSEGERIFEDDIIKIVEDGDKKTDNRPYDFNYGDVALILFDSRYCQFGAYNNSIDEIESIGNLVRTSWFNFIEVIGNIHDNPELLK